MLVDKRTAGSRKSVTMGMFASYARCSRMPMWTLDRTLVIGPLSTICRKACEAGKLKPNLFVECLDGFA